MAKVGYEGVVDDGNAVDVGALLDRDHAECDGLAVGGLGVVEAST